MTHKLDREWEDTPSESNALITNRLLECNRVDYEYGACARPSIITKLARTPGWNPSRTLLYEVLYFKLGKDFFEKESIATDSELCVYANVFYILSGFVVQGVS